MIDRLVLKNFTTFRDLKIDFSAKINVIIGENGTGKTQLLKAVYALCGMAPMFETAAGTDDKGLAAALNGKLLRLFRPLENKIGKLHQQGAEESASLSADFSVGQKITATFSNRSKTLALKERPELDKFQSKAVFIPTKEVLSLAKGISDPKHDQETIESIFDDGYVDLARSLTARSDAKIESLLDSNQRFFSVIPRLAKMIGGIYKFDDGEFCFQPGEYVEKVPAARSNSRHAAAYRDSKVTSFERGSQDAYSAGMTAEGFRKIGILHQLLCNGSISVTDSGLLIWDEPEANLNPKLMHEVVDILLELARNGQQIILATHDYVLLKWFDLLMDKGKGDHVRFHSVYRDTLSGQIEVTRTDDYRQIEINPIVDAFNQLTIAHAESRMRKS